MNENTTLKEGFSQVCVWPGTIVGAENVRNFTAFFKDGGFRVQYLEEILTAPDVKNGFPVADTGGRNDLFLAIHTDDISKFTTPRLSMGIRWIEDVLAPINRGEASLYPERVIEYCSWNETSAAEIGDDILTSCSECGGELQKGDDGYGTEHGTCSDCVDKGGDE